MWEAPIGLSTIYFAILGLLKTNGQPYQDGISQAAFPAFFALTVEAIFGAQTA